MILYFLMVASCMSTPVDGFLEVYKGMVEVLLVIEIFLTKDS